MIAGLLKRFVNSTIGTPNASSLDKIIAAGVTSIKSVQRGTYSGAAGTVTIQPVNMNKTIVLSVSKGSAGTAATNSQLY